MTSLHTQLVRLDGSGQPVGEPLAKGILTITLPSVLRQLSTFRTSGAPGPVAIASLYARFLTAMHTELAQAYGLPFPNQRPAEQLPAEAPSPPPPSAEPAPPPKPSLALCGDHVSFDELTEGVDLGCLEYVLDEERVGRYLAATGADNPRYCPEAADQRIAPPAILASDTLRLSGNRYRITGASGRQSLELMNPPRVGKRIIVRGRLPEKFRHKGRPFFVWSPPPRTRTAARYYGAAPSAC